MFWVYIVKAVGLGVFTSGTNATPGGMRRCRQNTLYMHHTVVVHLVPGTGMCLRRLLLIGAAYEMHHSLVTNTATRVLTPPRLGYGIHDSCMRCNVVTAWTLLSV